MQRDSSHSDVLILGGGLSGLAAADALRDTPLSVTLLEAKDYFGGRTLGLTWPSAGRKIDMGGTWLLPGFTEVFALLEELGVGTTESPDSDLWLTHFRDGAEERRFLDASELRALEDTLAALENIVEHSEKPLSAAEALNLAGTLKNGIAPLIEDWLHAVQRYLAGAPLEQIAAEHLLLDIDDLVDPEHYLTQIVGTTASLVEALRHRAEATVHLHTDAPATAVARDDAGFRVTTRSGDEYTASQLIVAMPLNRLSSLDWAEGLLGDYKTLAEAGHAGTSFKDWLILDEVPDHFRVLGSHGPYGYFRSEERLADGGMLCVGLVADVEAIRDTNDLELEIRKHYFPEATIRDRIRHDWVEDPAISGTWVVPRPGQPSLFQSATTGDSNLHLVGGDVDHDFPGTIGGAVRSGRQAAQKIINNENR